MISERCGLEAPVLQHKRAGGVLRARLGFVCGDDDGHAELAVDAEELVQEILLGHGVELGGRLVEQQEAGEQGERACHGDLLLFAARQVGGAAARERRQAEELRDLGDAQAHLAPVAAQVLEAKGELVADGVADDLGAGVLRDVADARGGLLLTPIGEVAPKDGACACQRADGGELGFEQAQQGGLAGAGRAVEQGKGALGQLPVEVAEHGRAVRVGKGETLQVDGKTDAHAAALSEDSACDQRRSSTAVATSGRASRTACGR